ncbi:uncharacterized protein LOC119165510 isoform X2 [Rhipicephalus microplus]|uniref:uncharacterized protein LOC119165510 isoform X2 n=1 Tax=Rhipicephalus microplus TaxID=6941 RepID=UPI003F6A6FC3
MGVRHSCHQAPSESLLAKQNNLQWSQPQSSYSASVDGQLIGKSHKAVRHIGSRGSIAVTPKSAPAFSQIQDKMVAARLRNVPRRIEGGFRGFCPHYRRPATACLAGCIVCHPGKPPTCYQRRRTFCLPPPWHPCFRIFGSATPPSVDRRDKSSHPIAVDNIPCAAYKAAATIQRALWASRLCHQTGR